MDFSARLKKIAWYYKTMLIMQKRDGDFTELDKFIFWANPYNVARAENILRDAKPGDTITGEAAEAETILIEQANDETTSR